MYPDYFSLSIIVKLNAIFIGNTFIFATHAIIGVEKSIRETNRREPPPTVALAATLGATDGSVFVFRNLSGPVLSRIAEPAKISHGRFVSSLSNHIKFHGAHNHDVSKVPPKSAQGLGRVVFRESVSESLRSTSAPTRSSSSLSRTRTKASKTLKLTILIAARRKGYNLPADTTLLDLRKMIEKDFRVDRSDQILMLKGDILNRNDTRLDLLGVNHEDTITLHASGFIIRVRIPLRPSIILRKVSSATSIREIKERLEDATGIVLQQQRIKYLEDKDLQNTSRLQDYNILSGSILVLHLWKEFAPIYRAVKLKEVGNTVWFVKNQIESKPKALMSDVTAEAYQLAHGIDRAVGEYRPPSRLGWAALFLAAFYGETDIALKLMQMREEPGSFAPVSHGSLQHMGTGKTPTHCAAQNGHLECLNAMLKAGAGFENVDNKGRSPEVLAKQRGNFTCAEALSLARWIKRVRGKDEANDEEKVLYGPFHTFEVSFGSTVPPGSSQMVHTMNNLVRACPFARPPSSFHAHFLY